MRTAEMKIERIAATVETKQGARTAEMEAERMAEVVATSKERPKVHVAETEVKRLTAELSYGATSSLGSPAS